MLKLMLGVAVFVGWPVRLILADTPPNVILILTDDQGYGDLACHGNPIIQTPNIDTLHAESVRLTDFHVDPFCTPSRAALMTGRYSSRTGAYRTSTGRTMMHTDEQTMAEVFRANGYATGIFGKWHLGDSCPHRPQDLGFTYTLWHRCGGVGQVSDYWGNDYFDDTYELNGEFKTFTGYCTDVWFDGALRFIQQNHDRTKPFFCYIPTNAPHGPYRVPDSYAEPYKTKVDWRNGANFYGMITNIDENVGRLRRRLAEWGLAENTLLIFMTDNGTSAGVSGGLDDTYDKGYNAGMRGKKSSVYDGGHRVPCFIHWPGGGIVGGRDVRQITAHIDLLPTLIELCELRRPQGLPLDGISLAPLLRGDAGDWPDRTLLLQFQGGPFFRYLPEAWRDSVVMTDRWRLMDGERLYDIEADPSQSHDIAPQHPQVVARLRAAYGPWWSQVKPRLDTPVRNYLGDPRENPTTLTSQEWRMPHGNPPWSTRQVNRLPTVTGPWYVQVVRPGIYEIKLCQKPQYVNFPIKAATAGLRIAGIEKTQPVPAGATGVTFRVALPAGPATLETFLTTTEGETGGAYFAYVKWVEPTD